MHVRARKEKRNTENLIKISNTQRSRADREFAPYLLMMELKLFQID
jgi:hypothetical protein